MLYNIFYYLVIENKDCLELELNELRFRHENVLTEKSMLEARLKNLHQLEGRLDLDLRIFNHLKCFHFMNR